MFSIDQRTLILVHDPNRNANLTNLLRGIELLHYAVAVKGDFANFIGNNFIVTADFASNANRRGGSEGIRIGLRDADFDRTAPGFDDRPDNGLLLLCSNRFPYNG